MGSRSINGEWTVCSPIMLEQRREFHMLEHRWLDSMFWRRRHEVASVESGSAERGRRGAKREDAHAL